MTPLVYATTMANRVKRERERIARMLEATANAHDDTKSTMQVLYELAESIRLGEGSGLAIRPVAEAITTEGDGSEVQEEEPQDGLPQHVDRDDFEDGIALVRSATTHGRSLLPRD